MAQGVWGLEQLETGDPGAPSARTRLRRLRERGRHDRATIDAILDDGFVCHVGFSVVRAKGERYWLSKSSRRRRSR